MDSPPGQCPAGFSNKTKIKMTHASLFSGIGGFDLAAQWMGWENLFHCEWNPFCQTVLKYHWPNATTYTDITKSDFTIWRGRVDILTGGFPCQPFSTAGQRKDTERTATSGRRCLERFEKLRQPTSWERMLTAFLLGQTDWYSRPCALTWKMKVTKSQRIAFQLVARTHRTKGTGGGLLATPNTMDVLPPKTPKAVEREATVTRPGRTNFSNLRDQLYHGKLLPTPTVNGNHNRAGLSEKSGDGRATRLAMLPTPRQRDWKGITQRGKHAPGDGISNTFAAMEANGQSTGLKLQPAFAFWMMGYPEDWTLRPFLASPNTPPENGDGNPSKPLETPSCPK